MNNSEEKKVSAKNIIGWVLCIVGAIALGLCIRSFVFEPVRVDGSSMADTLTDGEIMFVEKISRYSRNFRAGDIVIVHYPIDDRAYVKRIIGLPGDTICIEDGQVYLNDELLVEDYTKDGITPAIEIPQEGETFTVPDEHYFCMGDNRLVSVDSRYSEVGCITEEQIMGKAVLRLFPFNKIKTF